MIPISRHRKVISAAADPFAGITMPALGHERLRRQHVTTGAKLIKNDRFGIIEAAG